MTSPKDFGWWIESTDEDIYGPVTRETLTRFLTEGIISPNTGVRHCTEAKFAPAADQGLTKDLPSPAKLKTGDTLEKSWPKKTQERLALAESDVECAYHRRPAVQTCIRCLAPYCSKCQLKKRGKTFFMCKKCQSGLTNRRTGAYILDSIMLIGLPTWLIGIPVLLALGPESGNGIVNLIYFGGLGAFMFRDPLFGGAGPGKRLNGLKVVKHEDGVSPVAMSQGFIRSLPHLIPIFNLVDAIVPNNDSFQRRFGDSWAKTRVIDTDAKVEAARKKIRQRLEKKGIKMTSEPVTTLTEFAQLD